MVGLYKGYLLKFLKDEQGLISVKVLYCNYLNPPETIKHYYVEDEIITSNTCEEIDPADVNEELDNFFQTYGISIDDISSVENGIELVDNIMYTDF